MVNLYKLLPVLEQGMTLFQLEQWKREGLWFPISQYKRVSNEIQVVTNLFIEPDPDIMDSYHIQLYGNYDESEQEEWNHFLDENQWKIYPLLGNIMKVFLPGKLENYQILYTKYTKGFISVIAKPLTVTKQSNPVID